MKHHAWWWYASNILFMCLFISICCCCRRCFVHTIVCVFFFLCLVSFVCFGNERDFRFLFHFMCFGLFNSFLFTVPFICWCWCRRCYCPLISLRLLDFICFSIECDFLCSFLGDIFILSLHFERNSPSRIQLCTCYSLNYDYDGVHASHIEWVHAII